MSARRAERFNVEELLGLRRRLDEKRLDPGDYELLRKVIAETTRQRRRLWWLGLAQPVLLRMLVVRNWVRRAQGKPPLVPEEWSDNER